MAKIYSPSQTETWLRCPLKRTLHYGWESNQTDRGTYGAALGTVVHTVMKAYFHTGDDLELIGRQAAAEEIAKLEGYDIPFHLQALHNALIERGAAVGKNFGNVGIELLRLFKTVTEVEGELGPKFGNARIDLGGVGVNGNYLIVDVKSKLTMDARGEALFLADQPSLQMQFYRWAVPQAYEGIYPELMDNPIETAIALVVLEPRLRVKVYPIAIPPELLGRFDLTMPRVWKQMEEEDEGRAMPWMAAAHRDQYGDCEFKRACLELHLDPNLMSTAYRRRDDH